MKKDTNIFLSLLRELAVPHTSAYAMHIYEEHPYKYTFYGLKSLVERYGVKASGVSMHDKDEIASLPTPFVADYADDYVLVKGHSRSQVAFEVYGATSAVSLDDFKKKWGGHALLFYPGDRSEEPNYEVHRRNGLIARLEWGVLILCGVCILAFVALSRVRLTWVEALSLILSLFGCAISAMLLSQQLKVRNAFVESVCHVFKKSSCNNVLESKAAKVLGRYSWSEIGFSYFSANFICLLFSGKFIDILAYAGALALLYSLWSIWYQRRTSQWCPLCLMVQGVVISQFILCLTGGYYTRLSCPSLLSVGCLLAAYVAFALMLNRLQPLFSKSAELRQVRWQYNHLKMNDKVFHTLLSSEREYPTSGSTITFGHADGRMQVTIFSNPYCNPCAAMHKRLQGLIEGGHCRIQYCFTSFRSEWNIINKYMIAAYQQLGAEKAWDLYTKWYDKGKFEVEKFFDPYHLTVDTEAVESEFTQHEAWRKKVGFSATPTILVNGHKMPYGYVLEDLDNFI